MLDIDIRYDALFRLGRDVAEGLAMGFKGRPKRKIARVVKKTTGFSGHHVSTRVHSVFKSSLNKRLSSAYSRRRGHSDTGSVTVYSKGSARRSAFVNYSRTLSSFKKAVMVVGLARDSQTHKIAALCVTAGGFVTYTPATNRARLFRAVFGAETSFKAMIFGSSMKLYKYRYCEYIAILKFYNSICFIAKDSESPITISRSAGSSSMTLVRKTRSGISRVPVRLPSGATKLISSDVIVLLGHIMPRRAKYFKNTRAGYWRRLGSKPTVRGVVKNPVDHPHGGRSKTVLWQRSPWGRSTK